MHYFFKFETSFRNLGIKILQSILSISFKVVNAIIQIAKKLQNTKKHLPNASLKVKISFHKIQLLCCKTFCEVHGGTIS